MWENEMGFYFPTLASCNDDGVVTRLFGLPLSTVLAPLILAAASIRAKCVSVWKCLSVGCFFTSNQLFASESVWVWSH